MSALHDAVLAGEYARGLALSAELGAFTPEDLRWTGVCLFQQGEVVAASRHLEQAVLAGCVGAHIDLAALWRSRGQHQQALEHLLRVQLDHLPPLDRALWCRERGIVGYELGEGKAAVVHWLDEAWAHACGAPDAVQVSAAHACGLYAARFGEDRLAVGYLEFAASLAHPVRRAYIELARAASAAHLGNVQEAQASLKGVEELGHPQEALHSLLAYHQGQVYRIAGEVNAALEAYTRSIRLARHAVRPNTELHATLGVLAVASAVQDEGTARAAVARARSLARTPRDQAFLDLREGSWRTGREDRSALSCLHQALVFFQDREHGREAIWAGIHLAEAQWHFGEPGAAQATLQAVADGMASRAAPLDLRAELRMAPLVSAYLEGLSDRAYERQQLLSGPPGLPHVDLLTLGQSNVRVQEQSVRFRLARTVEVLAYLCVKGGARLADVQQDLFPDAPHAQSKSYFHQVRLDIRTHVPGLSIAYDEKTRLYGLHVQGVRLAWDVEALREALGDPDAFMMAVTAQPSLEFLRGADSLWAAEERERLRRWVTQVGLETMDGWFRTGEYEKCIRLAERLLPLDPLDDALHEFLVRATLEVRGRVVALKVYECSLETFEREVHDVPASLRALGKQLRPVLH